MTTPRNLDRLIRTYLQEDQAQGQPEVPDHVYGAIRDGIEQTRQRAVIGSMGVPDMNKFLAVGLGVAAVVVIAVIAINLLPGSPGPGGAPTDSAAPSQAPSEPASSAWTGLSEGPFVVTQTNDPVQVTVSIASPGWSPLSEYDAVSKDDDGLDAPASVGALLIAWGFPAGTGFNVYGDPCHWSTTVPETAATTVDEIVAAFATQALTDATEPVDVTVGGYGGKAITLHVPMSFDIPDATREEKFAECDENEFVFYGTEGLPVERNAQGAGQIDELWILDVNGAIVILDAGYSPATPANLVEETRTLAESATFE